MALPLPGMNLPKPAFTSAHNVVVIEHHLDLLSLTRRLNS